MIRYSKTDRARLVRLEAPEPPFGAASAILPYSFPRSSPIALNYVRLVGVGADRADVEVSTTFDATPPAGPVLIDSTEAAELVYSRGARIHQELRRQGHSIVQLFSTTGAVPEMEPGTQSLMILCSWPLHWVDLSGLARELADRRFRWGLAIPILFPPTTELKTIDRLAAIAAENHAEFMVGVRFDLDPGARRALATAYPTDDETYSTLFDEGMESVAVATERHIAAVATEHSLRDSCIPSDPRPDSNWTAALFTSIAGYRLVHMEEDVERGWELVRAARELAQLPKPISRIAEAASLSIVAGLSPQIREALGQWLETGRAALFDEINERWRLRRDYDPG